MTFRIKREDLLLHDCGHFVSQYSIQYRPDSVLETEWQSVWGLYSSVEAAKARIKEIQDGADPRSGTVVWEG